MIPHSLVPKVEEYNIGKIRGVERIERMREVKETIRKIK